MALTLHRDCPHCGGASCAFTFVAEVPHARKSNEAPGAFSLAFSCNSCFELVGLLIKSTAGNKSFAGGKTGNIATLLNSERSYILRKVYPARDKAEAPEHVSESVARCYVQAADNASRKNADAAGAMYRKCIDLATKELDPTLAGKKLAARIDALHAKGALTAGLKDWAHAIRLDGNDASHEPDELTPDEVEQLGSFTDLFLRYSFTLPKQVEMRKADASSTA